MKLARNTLVLAAAVFLAMFACKKQPEQVVKAPEKVFGPVVAGGFYKADPALLRSQIDTYLAQAQVPEIPDRLVAVICPHAGHDFSGPVAAYIYKAIQAQGRKKFVIIAPSHRIGASGGIAVLDADYYQTPLGKAKINRDKVRQLLAQGPWVVADDRFFAQEHSAEVQIPFLQVAAGSGLEIVLIVMPDENMAKQTADALNSVFPEPDWVFIASSDMSHFHPYQEANKLDKATLKLIEKMDIEGLARTRQALCGIAPVLTVLNLVKDMPEAAAKVITYKNSFDTSGKDPERVVGYGAVALTAKTPAPRPESEELQPYGGPLSLEEKRELMRIAKLAVETFVRDNKRPELDTKFERLKINGAAFVTLKKNGELRGCIGHVIAIEPLFLCVRDVACDAAKRDPRFPPVSPEELPKLEYEISVLSPMVPIKSIESIEVGKDGLLMRNGPYQGLLLPQVPTEFGWTREEFLAHTCNKAGMYQDCWTKPDTQILQFRGLVFGENDLK